MLRRCQVLLEDWQLEYIKNVAQLYDFSFSEVLRICLSEGFMHVINALHPEYKPGITKKYFAQMAKKGVNSNTPLEEKHKFISKIYFEARKAVEYRLKKIGNK
jgi:hypothetical protein